MTGGRICPPPNILLWHKDYFDLKAFERQWMQKVMLISSFPPENRRSKMKYALPVRGEKKHSPTEVRAESSALIFIKTVLIFL